MNAPQKQLELMKDKLDTCSSFIDYFIEIGVKPDLFRDTFLYEASFEELNSNFADKLTPSVISKFPPYNKKAINIDKSIISHIFPNGFNIIKRNNPPSNIPFSLVLDNHFLSAKYPHKYISCLMIYESISAYKSLYDIYSNIETNSVLSKYSTSSISFLEKDKEEYSVYYIPKCICFVSVFPFLDSHSKLLLELYHFTIKSKNIRNKVLIDKLIENIVMEIPAPPRGLHKIQYKFLDNEPVDFKDSAMNQPPLLDFEVEKIFKLFKVEDIIDIVKYLMQEVKLLFFSKYIRNLTPVILGFASFIFPFKYPFQVISVLSKNEYAFIGTISPYIIGINQSYTPTFFKDHSIDKPMNVIVVNIDRGEIEVMSSSIENIKNDIQKKKMLSEEFPDFPHSFRSKLERKLTKYIAEVSNRKVKENKKVYCKNFLSFMARLLSSYSKYLIYHYSESHKTNGDITSLFNSQEFYSSFNGNDKLFYKKLTETQMFMNFIYQRMLPRDTDEKIEVLFFDEHITRTMRKLFSKGSPNIFITSEAYNHNQVYQVTTSRGLSDKDIEFFNAAGNRQIALLNGNYCEMLTNDEIIFTYYLFPTLLTGNLFINNISEYYIPSSFNKDFEKLNAEMLLKSSMSYGYHISEMENYIYLSWVNIWALTFWYQEAEEKEYWFTRLLNVLDLIWNHELEIFELLFNILQTHGTKAMIIQLYSKMIKYHLNPSWEIFTLISGIKDNEATRLKILIKAKEVRQGESGYNINTFAPRTLKDSNDSNILTEEVLFYAYDNCINCQTQFDLFKECKDFKSMQREEMWIKCLQCTNNFLPTLKFRFGIELYNQETTPYSSSHIENIVLDSPKYLRENISSITHKEKDNKFEVEAFKLKYKKVFWNLIWYFKLVNLEIAFMLPYLVQKKTEPISTISNFLQFSTAKSICVSSSSKMLKRTTTSLTEEMGNTFDNKVVKEEKVIEFELLPVVEQSQFALAMNDNASFSGYTANNTDINSCINDNLFADNSMIVDTVSKFSEENYSDNETKFKRSYNKLKSIKEDFEEALNLNEDNKNKSDEENDDHIIFDYQKDSNVKIETDANKEIESNKDKEGDEKLEAKADEDKDDSHEDVNDDYDNNYNDDAL